MTVGSVVMDLPRNLSTLGTKNANFVCWNIYILPQNTSKQAPLSFKDGYRGRLVFFAMYTYDKKKIKLERKQLLMYVKRYNYKKQREL